jgi:hypothetical protein
MEIVTEEEFELKKNQLYRTNENENNYCSFILFHAKQFWTINTCIKMIKQ